MAKTMNVNLVFNANTQQVKAQLEQLKTSLNGLTANMNMNRGMAEYNQQIKVATGSLANLQAMLSQTTDSSGKLNISQFAQSMKQAGMTMSSLRQDLSAFGAAGDEAFLQLSRSVMNAQMPIRQTNTAIDKLWGSMKNVATWQISSKILYGFINQINTAYQYTQDLNESLNNIRIVTGYGTDEMSKFAEQANKAAKALSASTLEYTDAALIYYQQGLSGKEVTQRADTTIKLANVARTSGEEASEWMTAIWNNFDNGSKSLEYYADVLTKLGAETASSADEIAGGLEKFSAVANTVGLSYEYAAAALATITAQTRQSEDVVGTSLKTLFARIENLSLGDTLDDGTTLNKYSEALYKVGINIKDTSGELKSMDAILNEMGATWNTLSKDQQIALAQTVGGIRQYNQLIALMDNWDFFEKNVDSARNATGELTKQNDIYAESWEAANKRVKASAEDLYGTLLKDDFFISLTNGTANVLEGITNLIDKMGGLKTLLPMLLLSFTKLFGSKMITGVKNFANNMSLSSKSAQQMVGELKTDAFVQNRAMGNQATSNYSVAMSSGFERQAALMEVINTSSYKLTEQAQQQINMEMQKNQLIEDSILAEAKKADKIQEQLDYETKLKALLKDQIKSTSMSTAKKVTSQFDDNKFEIKTNNISKKMVSAKSEEDFIKSLKLPDVTDKELLAKLKTSQQEVDKFTEKLRNAYKEYEKLVKAQTDPLNKELDDSTNRAQILGEELSDSNKKLNTLSEQAVEQTKQSAGKIRGIQEASYGWSDAFMGIANGAMSAAMAIGMFQSAIQTWKDEDASFIDKLTSGLMTFGMIMPSAISLFKLFGTEKARATLATNLDTLATKLNNREKTNAANLDNKAKEIKKILTKRTEEKAVAEGEEAVAIEARKAAQNAPPSDSAPIPEVDPPTGKTLGKSAGKLLKALGPYLLAAALIAVGAVIIKGLTDSYNKSAKVLEKAKEDAKKTQEEVTKTKEAYDDLLNSTKSYQDSLKGLKELTAGTEEYNKALVEANYQAQELINKYKDYQDLKYTVVNGVITIDEDSLEQIAKYQSQELAIAQMNNTIAQQKVANAQQTLDEETYLRQQSQVAGYDEQDVTYGTSGALAGAAMGGGAAIGTLAAFGALNAWNPAGWIASGVAVAGALIGGIVGTIQDDDSQREHDMMEALKKEYSTIAKASMATGDKADNDDSWDNLYEVLSKQGYQDAEIKAFLTDDLSGIQEILKENARIEEEILEQNKLMVHQLNSNNTLYTELDSDEQAAVQGYITGNQDEIQDKLIKDETAQYEDVSVTKINTDTYSIDPDAGYSSSSSTEVTLHSPFEAGLYAEKSWGSWQTERLRQEYEKHIKETTGKNITWRHTEGDETFLTIGNDNETSMTYAQMAQELLDYYSKQVTPEIITEALGKLNNFKTDYGNVLYNLNDQDRQNLIGQFTSRSISNVNMLSQQEIDQLKQLKDDDYWVGMQSQVIAAEQQRAAILENINQNYNETVQGIVQDKDLADITSTLNIDEYRNLYELAEKFASANFEDKTLLSTVLGQSTDPTKTIEALNSIDYSMTNVDAVAAKMGGEIDTTTEEFKKLAQGLIENAIAAEADVDYFNKIIKALGEIKKIVEKLNIGDVISIEEYDSLIAKNAALADSFVRVADGYMLIEDASQFSEKALNSYQTTLEGAVEQAEKYSAAAKIIKELISHKEINTGAFTKDKKTDELNKLKGNNLDVYNAILTRGGYDINQDLKELTEEQIAELFKVITELVNTENIGGFSRVNTITSNLDLYSDSYSESQALIEQTATTEEEKITLQKTANALLRNELELEEDVVNSLKGQVKYLAQENGIMVQNDTLLESMALRYEALNKGVKNLVTNWESYEDAIEEGNQAETFVNIKKDLSTMFNIDNKDISDTFISSYWEDIKNLAQGTGDTEQIVNNLSQALAIAKLSADNLGNATEEAIIGTLQSSELMTLAYGEVVDTNTSVMIANLNRLLESSEVTASKLIEYFTIAGYQLDFVEGKLNSIRNVGTGSALNLNAYRANVLKNSGSTKKPEEFDPKRYHEIDEVLDSIGKKLDVISTKKDKAFGADKIKYVKDELKLVSAELDATKTKLDQAKSYLETDKNTILKYGVELDEDGNIKNYNEVRQRYYEQYKTNPEAYEDSWKQLNEDLDQYEQTLDEVTDLEKDHLDQVYKMKELALEKIELTVTFNIEASDDVMKYLDFVMKRLEEDTYDAAKSIDLLGQKTQETLDNITTYKKAIEDTLNEAGFKPEEITRFFDGDGSVFEGKTLTEDESKMLRDYRDKIIESSESLKEFRKQVFETALNVFNTWNEKLNENADKLERCNKLLETHKNIVDVVGRKYLNIDNEVLGAMAEARTNLAQSSVEAAAATYEANKATLESAKQELEKAKLSGDEDSIKEWEEFVKSVEKTTNESEEAMMDALVTAMETAGDVFEETVQRVMETLNEALGNIKELTDKFEKQRKIEELYLADHKKLYEINKLNRDIQNSIDSTDNVKAQRELAKISEEVMAYQAEGAQMSEYDLGYLQKRYELKKAEIALEEAQNAKNQVKLQRDSKGNWGYVYTADQKNIDKAQQDFNKSLYEVQEYSYQSERELTRQRLQLYEDWQNEISALREEDFASTEEYDAKLAEIKEHYTTRIRAITLEIKDLTAQNAIINQEYSTTMADTYSETLLGQMYPTYSTFEELMNGESQAIENSLTSLSTAYSTWSINVNTAMTNAKIDAETFATYMSGKFITDINKAATDTTTAAGKIATEMKTKLTDEKNGAIVSVKSFVDQFKEAMGDIYNKDGVADRIAKAMTDISKAATDMADIVISKATAAQEAMNLISKTQGSFSPVQTPTPEEEPVKQNWDSSNQYDQAIKYKGSTYVRQNGKWYKASGSIQSVYDDNDQSKVISVVAMNVDKTKTYSIQTSKDQNAIQGRVWENNGVAKYNFYNDAGIYDGVFDQDNILYGYIGKYNNGNLTAYALGKKDGVKINNIKGKYQVYSVYEKQKTPYSLTYAANPSFADGYYKINGNHYVASNLPNYYFGKNYKTPTFDTGGYTGSWGTDGRLAVLHQKEIVLNSHDTENFLSAVKIVRSMSDMLEHNAHIAMQGLNLEHNFAQLLNNKQPIEQNVKIEASFPNVTDRYEIEQAFNSLINDASQYANRK